MDKTFENCSRRPSPLRSTGMKLSSRSGSSSARIRTTPVRSRGADGTGTVGSSGMERRIVRSGAAEWSGEFVDVSSLSVSKRGVTSFKSQRVQPGVHTFGRNGNISETTVTKWFYFPRL
jgi:hypothetical protein